MPREQKIKSKASQTQSARSKRGVAATQAPDTTQTTADTMSTVSGERQVAENRTTTAPTKASNAITSAQQEQTTVQQSATGDQQAGWTRIQPNWPSWPSSKPGPRSTPPAPGTRSINRLRSEQLEEVGYNQQTGEPATQNPLRSLPDKRTTGPTSFDQPTAQDTVGKRKQRL